jgi:hypothetical protein
MAFCGLILQKTAAQPAGTNLYVVTHVDIAGTPAIVAESTRLLREFSADSQKDPGVVRFELLLQRLVVQRLQQFLSALEEELAQFRHAFVGLLAHDFTSTR